MREIRVLAATGMLGTGFSEQTLHRAMNLHPHCIGCDAGSSDCGPYYLGSGRTQASRGATKRDLRLMLLAGQAAGIPVIVGSAGTAGGEPHLAFTRDIVEEIAREEGLSFRMALIHAEMDRAFLKAKLRQGRIRPLQAAPPFDEDTIDRASRIVGMMGAEPFIEALRGGAQVVIAGRSSDTSIYAALPLMEGFTPGPVWHAAKILECGAASAVQRMYPDCMMATIREDHFIVEPPNPEMRCSPVSVVAHTLYENADPYNLVEASGTLVTSACQYEAIGDRAVRVSGSQFVAAEVPTIRLEGAEFLGHRFAVLGGICDPVVLRQLDRFLSSLKETIAHKVEVSLGLAMGRDYRFIFREYGRNGTMGPLEPNPVVEGHEVGVVMEAIGRTAEEARAIVNVAWHTGLHHPVPEWQGLISNFAFPYSPPDMDCGPVYRFCVNHVVEVDDPAAPFAVEFVEVGQPAFAGAKGAN